MGAREAAEIVVAPREFDALVEWVDRVSRNLVLLEAYSLPEVASWVDAVDRAVRDHLSTYRELTLSRSVGRRDDDFATLRRTLEEDHARFRVSLDQLRWFFRVVEEDDHGGNRQALGQYGRVLAEALRRHRRDERAYLGRAELPRPPAGA